MLVRKEDLHRHGRGTKRAGGAESARPRRGAGARRGRTVVRCAVAEDEVGPKPARARPRLGAWCAVRRREKRRKAVCPGRSWSMSCGATRHPTPASGPSSARSRASVRAGARRPAPDAAQPRARKCPNRTMPLGRRADVDAIEGGARRDAPLEQPGDLDFYGADLVGRLAAAGLGRGRVGLQPGPRRIASADLRHRREQAAAVALEPRVTVAPNVSAVEPARGDELLLVQGAHRLELADDEGGAALHRPWPAPARGGPATTPLACPHFPHLTLLPTSKNSLSAARSSQDWRTRSSSLRDLPR